jgi:hypothetical protein
MLVTANGVGKITKVPKGTNYEQVNLGELDDRGKPSKSAVLKRQGVELRYPLLA